MNGLEPTVPARKTVTVTQLNNFIKDIMDNVAPLRDISVKGEISNITLHRTGHIYLTVKDEGALLKAVMFRGDAEKLSFTPKNGDKIIITGRISVFVRDGVYQMYANSMELDGVGSLYIAFEQLKAKLAEEGLFDESHKKRLPPVPWSIGVITAPTGAAVRDMINISGRRFPGCEIVLYPSLVQGPDAAPNIIKGIEYFNRTRRVELIIVGRGGGSIEDLWAFNDENLARAIYASELPVISAVGHETDFTIADFVADLRAPTPSAAMELALPDTGELMRKFGNVKTRLSALLDRRLESEQKLLRMLSERRVFTSPETIYQDKQLETARLGDMLEKALAGALESKRKETKSLSQLLASYDPLGVLKRGYSVAYDKNGRIIKSESEVKTGEEFSVKLAKGAIRGVRTEN
ncbi:MAG: exodeoxyribonuclease VII large subunit [Clostridia bacterium]|nr:exodeoxyribonuclease VII large subunit [Clostridia bacterium]